jgi:hypothetical protein
MPYHIYHKKMDVLHYVCAYVSPDRSDKQMPYYTHHKGMAGLHCESAYVFPGCSYV